MSESAPEHHTDLPPWSPAPAASQQGKPTVAPASSSSSSGPRNVSIGPQSTSLLPNLSSYSNEYGLVPVDLNAAGTSTTELSPQEKPDHRSSMTEAPMPIDAESVGPVRNLVVTQLPRSLDTATLYKLFGVYGEIILALVMMDVHTGKSRGFGFVWYEESASAIRAMREMNGAVLEQDAKPLKVFASQHPNGLSEDIYIEVVNFPSNIARAYGREVFASFGRVVRYDVAPIDGRASGSGSTISSATTSIVVEYENVLQARSAIRNLHGQRTITVGTSTITLHLPLVTKYLIGGKKTSSNASSSPNASTGSRPRGGSHSSNMHMGDSGHAHPFQNVMGASNSSRLSSLSQRGNNMHPGWSHSPSPNSSGHSGIHQNFNVMPPQMSPQGGVTYLTLPPQQGPGMPPQQQPVVLMPNGTGGYTMMPFSPQQLQTAGQPGAGQPHAVFALPALPANHNFFQSPNPIGGNAPGSGGGIGPSQHQHHQQQQQMMFMVMPGQQGPMNFAPGGHAPHPQQQPQQQPQFIQPMMMMPSGQQPTQPPQPFGMWGHQTQQPQAQQPQPTPPPSDTYQHQGGVFNY